MNWRDLFAPSWLPLNFVLFFVLLESFFPARRLRRVRGRRGRLALTIAFSFGVGWLCRKPIEWLAGSRPLFNLADWPVVAGVAVAFVVGSFVAYWIHRAAHRSDFLWRTTHQLHHSATRLDALTAFYQHPLSGLLGGLVNALVVFKILGLGPLAYAGVGLWSLAIELFSHANLRTPRWWGYLIPRPEMHSLHHERGRHDRNYANFPVWDLLFGTFENPAERARHFGFNLKCEFKFWEILRCRKVA